MNSQATYLKAEDFTVQKPMRPVFELDHLTVNFPSRKAAIPSPLQNLNLKIEAERITTILGRSGCGKTSTETVL